MSKKGKLAGLAAAALMIFAAIAWYFESPAWTLRNMKAAVDAQDADALSSHIDYPALRSSLKAQLLTEITGRMEDNKSGLASVGLALGSAVIV
ncbi:MAG TPA: DUF2939 domain-containing protein, partial [Sphingomicrobium sp.]|nr:DUF2939 domain-containing protein [Sphingomicrobium sp.]